MKQCLYTNSSMTIEANGDIRLCSSSLPIFNLKVTNLSIEEVWNSVNYQKINDSLSKNIFPIECQSCELAEKENLTSRRMSFQESRKRIFSSSDLNIHYKERKIRHLSVAFSNSCNLKCSMCGSLYSTSWIEEEKKAKEAGINFRENHCSTPFQLSDSHIKELVNLSSNLDTILIKGGEPFLSSSCLYFLNELRKLKSRPRIFIQTNGTILNEEILGLIKDLSIDIGFSIDGIGSTYEWVRGANFSSVANNLKRVCELESDIDIFVDFTTSIYNAHDISNFLNFFGSNDRISKISFTTIARQKYNSIRCLSKGYREEVLNSIDFDKFSNLEGVEVLKEYFDAPEFSNKSKKMAYTWLKFLETERGEFINRAVFDDLNIGDLT